MDLSLTAEQTAFRDGVRDWLSTNVPSAPLPPLSTPEGYEARRAWERRLYDAGFAAVHWPQRFGGLGLDPLSAAIFYEEYVQAGGPGRLNRLGLGLCGPTLIDLGTPDQQDRWLTNILTCQEIWCQGFSEPEAGSDLAGIRSRGEVSSDGILVNGQKIWTSNSRYADWMFALVRTGEPGGRHRGLTFLMIDMHDPGVEVRPIKQINGAAEFSEVFITDVVVPNANIVGEVNEGWQVAMATLGHERGSSLNMASHFAKILDEVIALVPDSRRTDSALLAQIGRAYEEIEAYRYMTMRTLSQLAQGKRLTGQSMMGKLWWSEMQVRIYELGLSLVREDALLVDGQDGEPSALRERYWMARAALIYAGSNEIQRNIISERLLGLPKEPHGAV